MSTTRRHPLLSISAALGSSGRATDGGSESGQEPERPRWQGLLALITTAVAAVILGAAIAGVNGDAVRVIAAFVALGALVVAFPLDRWALGAAALVATWLIAVLVVKYLPNVFNPPPPVGQAVGGAAFFDTPYRGGQIGAVVSVAIPAVCALAVVAIEKRRERTPGADPEVEPGSQVAVASSPAPASGSMWMWIGAAILAFTLVPDLREYLRNAGDAIPYSWDVSNLTAWQGFVQMGLTPMKGFFYPYGFQWLYTDGNFGPVFQWIAQVAMIALAAWSLWRLTSGSTWRVLACLFAALLVGYWGGVETWRYFPALLVPVTYAAIGPGTHSRLGREHAVFFAACLLAALVEPDLLLFGIAGALLVVGGQIVGEQLPLVPPRRIVVGLAFDVAAVIAAALVMLLVWVATGTATANLRFYGGFSAVSATSAPDEKTFGAVGLLVVHPNANSLYVAIPALLAAAGFLWCRLVRGQRAAVGSILLGASGVSLVMVLKHLVRPVDDLVLIAPLIALLWAVILAWRRNSLLQAVACGLALAALYTMIDETGALSFSQFLKTSVSSPVHAVRSVQVAFNLPERVRAAEERTAPARFAGWPDSVIAGYYLGTVKTRPWPPFAIVGDSQETYVLLGQRPPWETDLYDSAPISEQDAMLKALAGEHPAYVIWRRDYFVDGVLYDIRDPLIFAWMIRNYVPIQEFPTVDILRRRGPGEAVPAAFWAGQLGTTEQLGYIPSLSSAAGSPRCAGGPGCVPYILVRGSSPVPVLRFQIIADGASYTVELNSRSGVVNYPVRADRLWFWPLVGAAPKVVSITRGYTARLVGLRSGDNLY